MSEASAETVFTPAERLAQNRWGNPAVWDRARIERLIWDHIPDQYRARVESLGYFFLATSNARGECDCSFKGGGPGLVRILDSRRLAYPDFDGNHAFMSLGNLIENPHVGMLFIDFGDGGRLRVNGRATIHDSGEALDWFTDARRVVVVEIEQVVANCARHVPHLVPAEAAP